MQSSCYRAFDGKRVHVSGNIVGLRRRTEDVHDQNSEHLRLAVIRRIQNGPPKNSLGFWMRG